MKRQGLTFNDSDLLNPHVDNLYGGQATRKALYKVRTHDEYTVRENYNFVDCEDICPLT